MHRRIKPSDVRRAQMFARETREHEHEMRTEWAPEQVSPTEPVSAALYIAVYGSGATIIDDATGGTRR